jgi:hypothetical protein
MGGVTASTGRKVLSMRFPFLLVCAGFFCSGVAQSQRGCCVSNQCVSPIIIDTTGGGFHLTSAEDGVMFDIAGDGHPIQLAWTQQPQATPFLHWIVTTTGRSTTVGNYSATSRHSPPARTEALPAATDSAHWLNLISRKMAATEMGLSITATSCSLTCCCGLMRITMVFPSPTSCTRCRSWGSTP